MLQLSIAKASSIELSSSETHGEKDNQRGNGRTLIPIGSMYLHKKKKELDTRTLRTVLSL
jgi:hypothetical protein